MSQVAEFQYPEEVHMRSYNPTKKPHIGQIRKVVKLLKKAKKPLIYSGGGVVTSGSHDDLTWLGQKLNIPVTSTLMGLGAFPGEDDLFLGMLGMHGTYAANMAVNNCDLLLAVGARFDDRVTGKVDTFAPDATIIHIDVDPTSIQKNVSVHVPLVADCREALSSLRKETQATLDDFDWAGSHKEWVDQVQAWSSEHPLTYNDDDKSIKPQYVVEKIYEITKGDAIIATEVGQNQMWAAQFFKYNKPNTLLTSGGLGTMGYGFPAAMGAQKAFLTNWLSISQATGPFRCASRK